MKKIGLTQNKVAWVDDEDYKLASSVSWWTSKNPNKTRTTFNAIRKYYINKKAHRLSLAEFILGDRPKGFRVLYRNGNGLDCRRCNIVYVDYSTSIENASKSKNRPGIFKGVHHRKCDGVNKKTDRYCAFASKNNKMYNVGSYKTEVDAARARDKKIVELYGNLSLLNLPDLD